MLDVTLDLITQTASSSLLAFCFCNLIIVIILVGSKPGSQFEKDESHTPHSVVSNTSTTDDKEVENLKSVSEEKNELVVVSEVSNEHKELADGEKGDDNNKDDEDEGKEEEEQEEEEEDDDDELRKKVEEFIQKVNREWKAESLRLRPEATLFEQ